MLKPDQPGSIYVSCQGRVAVVTFSKLHPGVLVPFSPEPPGVLDNVWEVQHDDRDVPVSLFQRTPNDPKATFNRVEFWGHTFRNT